MKEIVIVGSGGFAKEVAFLIDEINKKKPQWEILGYIDKKVGGYNGKYRVFNHDEWLLKTGKEVNVVFGIGDPELINKLARKFKENSNLKFPNLIHPNVIGDWERISLGEGNIVCAGNIFTTGIKIGSFNIFNIDSTIGHDVMLGSCNVINPSVNISGGIEVGDEVLIGTGCQILQYVKIASHSVIGAGSLVRKEISEPGVYVGVPATKLR